MRNWNYQAVPDGSPNECENFSMPPDFDKIYKAGIEATNAFNRNEAFEKMIPRLDAKFHKIVVVHPLKEYL